MMLDFARLDLCSTIHDIEHEDVLGEALWRGTVNQEVCDGDKR